ncbi:hypothetical protein KJA15_01245 [Patescibacteria group bacterium]|nr:hypothetical protein [Patescibacteria group bacterium]
MLYLYICILPTGKRDKSDTRVIVSNSPFPSFFEPANSCGFEKGVSSLKSNMGKGENLSLAERELIKIASCLREMKRVAEENGWEK